MSKAKFEQAKTLIQQKRYDEARTVLRELDHPTAREWLTKLDKIAPEKPKRQGLKLGKIMLWLAAIIALLIALQMGRRQPSSTSTAQPTRLAAQIAASVTPSATITETATAASATMQASLSDRDRNATAFATLSGVFNGIPGVTETRMARALETARGWDVYMEMVVASGEVTTDMANAIRQATHAALVSANVEITMILDDGQIAASYTWDNQTDNWRIVTLSSAVQSAPTIAPAQQIVMPTSAPVIVQPGFVCPRTCATAVALGMGEVEIAQKCPKLDRNQNGVACYGS